VIPKAAQLKGVSELDTAFGYHFDLTNLPADYDPLNHAASLMEL
jgi:hypothetical protein